MQVTKLLVAALFLTVALGALLTLPAATAEVDTTAFYEDVRVDADPESGNEVDCPRTGVFNTTVFIMWADKRNTDWDIFIANSTDGGLIFNQPIRVDDTDTNTHPGDGDTDQRFPDFVIDSAGNIHAVWQDNRDGYDCIYYSRSGDGGVTWTTNKRIDDLSLGDKEHPRIHLGLNEEIYVVFEDERNSVVFTDKDIYFTMSSNGGNTFLSTNIRVDDATADTKQILPNVASDDEGNIYVAWSDERIGDLDIYSAVSTDGGLSFNWPCVKVSDDPTIGAQTEVDLVCINTTAYYVWYDTRGNNNDLRMTTTDDYGLTFGNSWKVVTGPDSTKQYEPSMCLGPDNEIYVAWSDNRNITSDVVMSVSYDKGATWANETMINEVTLDSEQEAPSMVVDQWGKIHVAFLDNRNGDRDIFYSRSVAGGMPGVAPELTDVLVSPESGDGETQFKFQVTYTDDDNDPPGPGYPKLYIYREVTTGVWVDFPNSPFNMTHQSIPVQDYTWSNGEIYQYFLVMEREYNYTFKVEARAAWGNTTMTETGLYNKPLVDETPVTFGNFTPGDGVWHNDTLVSCGVNVSDTEGVGVDVSSIQYTLSTEGPDAFDRWIPLGSQGLSDGPFAVVSKDVVFENGSLNYIKWRAKDLMGNGIHADEYQESEPVRVFVDTTAPKFSSASPGDGVGQKLTSEVQLGAIFPTIEIWDTGGSGVDRDTIHFRFSTTGPNTFGDWVKVDDTNISIVATNNQSFRPMVNIIPDPEGFNYIQWKATDLMGNERESNAVHLNIVMAIPEPDNYPPEPPTVMLPTESSSVTPYLLWSGASDVEGQDLTYWVRIGSTSGGGDVLPWTYTGSANTYQIGSSLNLSYGTYYVQIISNDGVLNSTTFEATLTLSGMANTPPSPPTSITPDAVDDHWPRIRWEGASDADNDTLIYFIQIGKSTGAGDMQAWVSTGTKTYFDAINYMATDTYYVQIRCCDGQAFSDVYEESLQIGKFELIVTPPTSVTILEGNSSTYSVNITNKGTVQDLVSLHVEGSALDSGINISLGAETIVIDPEMSLFFDLIIDVPEGTPIEIYKFRIVAISKDGVTTYVAPVSIVVVGKSGETPDPDGGSGTDGQDGAEDGGEDGMSDEPFIRSGLGPLLVALILAAVIGVAGVMIYLKATEPKKQNFGPPTEEEPPEEPEEGGKRASKPDSFAPASGEMDEGEVEEPKKGKKGKRKK